MSIDDEDFPEKPDWHRKGQTWVIRLPNGDHGTISYDGDGWTAMVVRDRKVRVSRVYKVFARAIAWSNKELFPRLTAWDRVKAV